MASDPTGHQGLSQRPTAPSRGPRHRIRDIFALILKITKQGEEKSHKLHGYAILIVLAVCGIVYHFIATWSAFIKILSESPPIILTLSLVITIVLVFGLTMLLQQAMISSSEIEKDKLHADIIKLNESNSRIQEERKQEYERHLHDLRRLENKSSEEKKNIEIIFKEEKERYEKIADDFKQLVDAQADFEFELAQYEDEMLKRKSYSYNDLFSIHDIHNLSNIMTTICSTAARALSTRKKIDDPRQIAVNIKVVERAKKGSASEYSYIPVGRHGGYSNRNQTYNRTLTDEPLVFRNKSYTMMLKSSPYYFFHRNVDEFVEEFTLEKAKFGDGNDNMDIGKVFSYDEAVANQGEGYKSCLIVPIYGGIPTYAYSEYFDNPIKIKGGSVLGIMCVDSTESETFDITSEQSYDLLLMRQFAKHAFMCIRTNRLVKSRLMKRFSRPRV